jgi:dinuclear metal center YbgI/SA1388 family protein
MFINDIILHLESIAPPSYQEPYDNAGLITGSAEWECKGVLTCLDATEEVVQGAIQKNCNLIIAHHPIIFSGLKKINGKNYVEKAVIKAIKHDIAIYAIHTNLDNVLRGVNDRMADRLQLVNRKILAPKETNNIQDIGSGLIGELTEPIAEKDLLALVKQQFGVTVIRHTPLLNKPVKKVALCGGAGSFLISNALAAGADIFITADMKYHEFFDANGRMVIADVGHYESEQFTIDLLYDILREKFPTFAVLKTGVSTNPVRYYLG